ncbi:MAG: hypothetical protein QM811_01865 [Pirellulales bacterium]
MRLLGTTSELTANIVEPEPGRRLEERIPENDSVTAFTVDPLGETRCRTTIEMTMRTPGVKGWLTRIVLKRPLGNVFREELRLLAEFATTTS